jgi:hypothetical protein
MKNILRSNSAKRKRLTTISILIFTMLFSVMLSSCSGEDYGTKINFGENNELYYTENVTLEESQALGDYLVKGEFFAADDNKRTVQLNKTGSTYEFRMVVKEGLDKDQATIDVMETVAADLSANVFNDEVVDVHLCDDTLKTLRVVMQDDTPVVDYGTKINFGENNELYYTESVTVKQAQALGDYLVKGEFFAADDNKRTIQLNKTGSTLEFRMVVKTGLDQDQATIDTMKTIAADLSENVFNGETVDVHLCDDTLKTLRVLVAN